MTEELRLGRRIVLCYELTLALLLAIVAGLCLVYHRPWHKVAKRLISPALLMWPLANGNRWARAAHAVATALVAWSVFRFGLRHPSPGVWMVCAPLSLMLAWLSVLIGFSRGVTAYLALRRQAMAQPANLNQGGSFSTGTRCGATRPREDAHGSTGQEAAGIDHHRHDVVCPGCGAGRRRFVVVCPWCGDRQDELLAADALTLDDPTGSFDGGVFKGGF